ncbi:hypothetical protein Trydic_g2886 [Trypoxylus dichotomus]
MTDFDRSRFTGVWYVVKDSSQSFTCTKHVITRSPDTSLMLDKEINLPVIGMGSHFDRLTSNVMTLSIPDAGNPGLMELNTTWNLDPKNLIVFATDYSNFAGVLLCSPQPVKYIGYISAVNVFARSPRLKSDAMKVLEKRMEELDIKPEKFFDVNHEMCEGRHKSLRAELDEYLHRSHGPS